MYSVAVKRDFVAQHFLIGGDWGAENQPHSHHYMVEVELRGSTLDKHGYLVDIVDITANLDGLVARYRDAMLNFLPEFDGLNPSIEHFARIFCLGFREQANLAGLSGLRVRLWENDIAWASYQLDL
ncbi:MAG: 6-carboxytetrahydropterin synthase [Chloroflexi bacterium]|nr:6-carboxytetrahydropterin synthase [Chloroflexota bacterium]